jgi:hypothetical protein
MPPRDQSQRIGNAGGHFMSQSWLSLPRLGGERAALENDHGARDRISVWVIPGVERKLCALASESR